MGFAEPTGSPRPLVRSYRTVSPSPVLVVPKDYEPSAVCSLWHFPAGHPDWLQASILSYGAPTFLSTDAPEGSGRGHPVDSPSGTSLAGDFPCVTRRRELTTHGTWTP